MKFDTHRICAAAVFAVSLIVYTATMADTCSFWDCGEFAACSYTMAVPHPPGSPLFLLVGRIFSLLPISRDIGVRVTFLSPLASALAILLAYLIIVRLIRHIRGPETTVLDQLIAYGGGVIGSLSLAWSYSMWFNAVESEVYASSQFFTHLVIWLILVWHEKADEPGSERWLLLIAYMVGLSTGIHLLAVLALPALALVMYFRKREKISVGSFVAMAALTAMVFVLVYPGVVKWLPLTASKIGLVAPVVIVLGVFLMFWWAVRNRHGVMGILTAGLLLIVVSYSAYLMIYIRSGLNTGIDENDPDTPSRFFSYLNREQYGERSILPRVWNNDPDYRSESDFFWRYQVNKMFNRYLFWQFIGREGAPTDEFQDAGVSPKYSVIALFADEPTGGLRWLAVITCVPFLLGLGGFAHQFLRDRRGWLVVFALFFMTGYAIILYLNQDNPQPRERDYSYAGAFFAFALWIGIGAGAAIEWVSRKVKQASPPVVAGAAAILLLLLSPVMLLARNYEMNDRSGNYVAWDYSYNMLMSCAPNAVLFTNGDNDTFPVWYLQEVEGVRRDVRIVNLSLVNTGWYIKQLKYREPKVPISFSDAYIDRYLDQHDAQALLQRYWPPDKQKVELNTPEGKMVWTVPASMYIPYRQGETRQNNFLRVQDIMILDILRSDYDAARMPVPKPVYFAVTVANSNMIGLRDYLTMEGLVFRVNPRGRQVIDADAIRRGLFETFKGHFRGIADPAVHFDDNVEKLLQNYRAAFLQLAYYYSMMSDSAPEAGSQYSTLDQKISHFGELSNHEKALTLLLAMDRAIPEAVRPISNADLSMQVGKMYHDLGRPDELRRRLEMIEARPNLRLDTEARLAALYFTPLRDESRARKILDQALGPGATSEQYYRVGRELLGGGAGRLAVEYLERALAANPNDGQAIGALLQAYENVGDRARAMARLESWVNAHPSDRGAKQRLDQMRAQTASGAPGPTDKN